MSDLFSGPAMHAAQDRLRKWMRENPAKFRRLRARETAQANRAYLNRDEGRNRARRDTRDRPSR